MKEMLRIGLKFIRKFFFIYTCETPRTECLAFATHLFVCSSDAKFTNWAVLSMFLFVFFPVLHSTINPILYNVMSHRYRIAFRETLCSRRRGFYSSTNGFVRDQSSFRETTIAAASRDHNLNYEGSQLVNIETKALKQQQLKWKTRNRKFKISFWKRPLKS